jgi:hypothetical protein
VEQVLEPAEDPTAGLESSRADPRLIAALGDRVAPVTMSGERLLPVPDGLGALLPEGGLVRGRAMSCTGSSATSLAMSLVAPAIADGAWLAVVDLPTIGLDAASEYGIPLERLVRISTDTAEAHRWADAVTAAADGFDVLLVSVPGAVAQPTARKVMMRVQQTGAVVVVLGDPGALSCDAQLRTGDECWEGLTAGAGRLLRRRVTVTAAGRRIPRRRRCVLHLPGAAPACGDDPSRHGEQPDDRHDQRDHSGTPVVAVA